jgi:hypothetical protein
LPDAKTSQAATINAKYAADLQATWATMDKHHIFADIIGDLTGSLSRSKFSDRDANNKGVSMRWQCHVCAHRHFNINTTLGEESR